MIAARQLLLAERTAVKAITAMESNLFVKNYGDADLAEAEFQRTLAVYEQVARSNPSRLRIARPIEVKNSTVYFERIKGCFNLRKSICRLCVDTEILYHVGQALAELHLALNPQLNSLDDNINIHGDLSATNVLYQPSTGLVYIVDFAPYRYDRSESYSYAAAYRDLAHIVLTLEIKYPMHKIYLLARKKNEEMSCRFWSGYESIIGRKIDRNKLFAYIIDDIDLSIRRSALKNPISRRVWGKLFKRAKQRYISRKELAT